MQPMLSTLEVICRDTVQARMQELLVYYPVLTASLERSRLETRRVPRPCV
jgi:hypothetical protein